MEIKKGKVHSLDTEEGKWAKCVPDDNSEIVTRSLVIPYYWRKEMGNIQVGEEVYFLQDDALNGYIIGRCDGEWNYTLDHDLNITGNLTVDQDINVGGNVAAEGDVTAGSISLSSHTHLTIKEGEDTTGPS